jgi:hypothetical protein
VFNRPLDRYISAYDQPFLLTIAASYTLPVLHTNKLVSWVARDWQINTLLGYGSGLPIEAPIAQNNLNNVLLRSDATGTNIGFADPTGQPFFTENLNCHCFDSNKVFVLNPAAWSEPAPGQWGTGAAYYAHYRNQRRPKREHGSGPDLPCKRALRAEHPHRVRRRFQPGADAGPDLDQCGRHAGTKMQPACRPRVLDLSPRRIRLR